LLPEAFIKTYKLLPYPDALTQLHFPDSAEQLDQAKRTMSFIEIFELMLASKIIKQEIAGEQAPRLAFEEAIAKQFVDSLPFKLTDAQRKVSWQALKDIDNTQPANRLVE